MTPEARGVSPFPVGCSLAALECWVNGGVYGVLGVAVPRWVVLVVEDLGVILSFRNADVRLVIRLVSPTPSGVGRGAVLVGVLSAPGSGLIVAVLVHLVQTD